MLLEHDGKKPFVAESAYIAPTAVVCGDVRIGRDCQVLFGAVLVADGGPVELGESCVVMENALVRGRPRHPTRIGDRVLVGPHAHLNGATVDSDVFIATGASVFPGAHIETGVEVRINAVVHVNTRVLAETTVPIGWIAVGDPAELYDASRHEEYWPKLKALDFPNTLFGRSRDELTMEAMTAFYVELFRRHRGDHRLD
jgi:carbonic anhydrase/acetyltransferase-like protein (isoleucine patch superfamily)